MSNSFNVDVPDVEMDEVYEEGEREEFPPQDFEAEEESPREGGEGDSDDEGETKTKKIKRAGAAKKIVKNPQAKLDDMRLCGQRGIPLIPKTFKYVNFKGKGHEVRDLDLYLSKMEHWAHRMFPKMVFDEVIERCDRLHKTKKLVKTTLIRMRNGDNLLDDDDVVREGDDDGDDDVNDDIDDDDFPSDAPILSSTRPMIDPLSQRLDADDEGLAERAPGAFAAAPQPVVISEEMRERMERNKRLAMERRKARMEALENKTTDSTLLGDQPNHQLEESNVAETVATDASKASNADVCADDPPRELNEDELLQLINS